MNLTTPTCRPAPSRRLQTPCTGVHRNRCFTVAPLPSRPQIEAVVARIGLSVDRLPQPGRERSGPGPREDGGGVARGHRAIARIVRPGPPVRPATRAGDLQPRDRVVAQRAGEGDGSSYAVGGSAQDSPRQLGGSVLPGARALGACGCGIGGQGPGGGGPAGRRARGQRPARAGPHVP